MSRSIDPGHFFQTSESLATSERKAAKAKNKNGSPVKLPSKILAVHADPLEPGVIYVAEAAGVVRRIVLETSEKSTTYTGATAPLTSIAISPSTTTNKSSRTLFAGCWDKSIHSWSLPTRRPLQRYTGHSDFVKCLLCTTISNTPILISGSADATIIVWDLLTAKRLHILKGHARGILDLAIDPTSLVSATPNQTPDSLVLFSADSVREILHWTISLTSATQITSSAPISAHETSVNRLCFEPATISDDSGPEGDLWTASSDKTAAHLVRSRGWEADTVLPHPDFVRDIVVDVDGGWVVTACRDEEVRVWDAASGKLACVYSGHYEEVTGLTLAELGGKKVVVSVGIDGTVRNWSLDNADVRRTREEAEKAQDGEVEVVQAEAPKGMLTAEEEAELADLMDDDDD